MEYLQTLIGPEKEGMNVLDYYFHVFAFRFPWSMCLYSLLITTAVGFILRVLLRKYRAEVFVGVFVLWALFLILYFTIVSRSVRTGYEVMPPFWSLREMANGNGGVLFEKVLNIFLFIPLGMLSQIEMLIIKRIFFVGWSLWIQTAGICIAVSLFVEILQLLTKRGTCEIDDIVWNTLGALVGIALVMVIAVLFTRVNKMNEI